MIRGPGIGGSGLWPLAPLDGDYDSTGARPASTRRPVTPAATVEVKESAGPAVDHGVRKTPVAPEHQRKEGALVCQRDRIVHFPAFPVAVVDKTAAGDAFNGALAVGLAAGGTLEEAVPLAGAAAALTCTRRGAQDSLPERAEVERFLRALRAGEEA
ncbi:MAG: hypothetical protein HYY95_07015 [Candidatus Rokubacteria bacterium]|nr:hypothetical protein [Candidatus Rokubacteria bacterium]